MKERIVWVLGAVAVVAVIALVINSGKEPEKEWVDITPEVDAYYEEHADFFQVKSLGDIPGDLEWRDGDELESFASPDAKQGGTMNFWMQDFPPHWGERNKNERTALGFIGQDKAPLVVDRNFTGSWRNPRAQVIIRALASRGPNCSTSCC